MCRSRDSVLALPPYHHKMKPVILNAELEALERERVIAVRLMYGPLWVALFFLFATAAAMLTAMFRSHGSPSFNDPLVLLPLVCLGACVAAWPIFLIIGGVQRFRIAMAISGLLDKVELDNLRALPRPEQGEKFGKDLVLASTDDLLHVARSRQLFARRTARIVSLLIAIGTFVWLAYSLFVNFNWGSLGSAVATLFTALGILGWSMKPICLQWMVDSESREIVVELLAGVVQRTAVAILPQEIEWFALDEGTLKMGGTASQAHVEAVRIGEQLSPVFGPEDDIVPLESWDADAITLPLAVVGPGLLGRWRARRFIDAILERLQIEREFTFLPDLNIWRLESSASGAGIDDEIAV